MQLTDLQLTLFDFVKEMHGSQLETHTGDPYYLHLLRVAKIVSPCPPGEMAVEIALCHDLIEKTDCGKNELALKLIEMGFGLFPRNKVLKGVYDLTTRFTDPAQENERMADIIPVSQTVKYADIIDNLEFLLKYDPQQARVYMEEIIWYIEEMNEGDAAIYLACGKVVNDAIVKLELNRHPVKTAPAPAWTDF